MAGPATLHWDLMLEHEGVLLTWALAEEPACERAIAAVRLADHRLHYLDYEGPVSGDRGSVRRWDRGVAELREVSAQRCVAELRGTALTGVVTLAPVAGESAGAWSAQFARK